MTKAARPNWEMDPELRSLFILELKKHLPIFESGAEFEMRRALHALKGTAGMLELRSFAEAIARMERRFGASDRTAAADAVAMVKSALSAIESGEPISVAEWPTPPGDLVPCAIDPKMLPVYQAEMTDRVARIDESLSSSDTNEASMALYRHVHAMKGAAFAVGDEVTGWFCHGLESRLRELGEGPSGGKRGVEEVTKWRGVLGQIAIVPEHALEMLRALDTRTSPPEARPPGHDAARRLDEDASIRIPTATIDRLLERIRTMAHRRARVSAGSSAERDLAGRTRAARAGLLDALRLIGPPRPWGAPAAAISRLETVARELLTLSDELDESARQLRMAAEHMREDVQAAHTELNTLRTTEMGSVFERVRSAVAKMVDREHVELRIEMVGGDTPVERRVAEQLLDPILQLARNAAIHGIESKLERVQHGKEEIGTITLSAVRKGGRLRIEVADDGRGVDLALLRRDVVERGHMPAEIAVAADDEGLLRFLFLPGFTTRDRADVFAGRGVGLDLAAESVRRMGGRIRLFNQSGKGLHAILDVPSEFTLLKVLWVEVDGMVYAIPAMSVERVSIAQDSSSSQVPPLSRFLGAKTGQTPNFVLLLESSRKDVPGLMVSVHRILGLEEVLIRRVSPIVMSVGPYAGVVIRGESIALCLDVASLVEASQQALPQPPRPEA